MEHIFRILHSNNNELKNSLADSGIKTFDDVLKHRAELGKGTFIKNNVSARIQKELSQVADWFDEFSETNGRDTNLIQDLTEANFEDFLKRHHTRYNLCVNELYTLAKGSIHDSGPPSWIKGFKEEDRADVYKQIYEKAIDEVKETQMTDLLHNMMDDKATLQRLLDHWVKTLFNFEGKDTFKIPFVVGGKTQSGKSPSKAVCLAVCRTLKVPSAVITTGVAQSRELTTKFHDFVPENYRDLVVGAKALRKRKTVGAEVKRVLENGGAFVVADTMQQVEKVNNAIDELWQGKKFCVIVDEGK